jgi:uroporphyrinogen-III synthase
MSIEPAEDLAAAKDIMRNIAGYQLVIFISPNAVKYGLHLIDQKELSHNARICAVGKGTERELAEAGVSVGVMPDGTFDSESLLAMPELNEVSGERILIVRGNGGRMLLGNTLRERGAKVEYAEVYSRNISSIDPGPLVANWEREVDIVTATSCGILENLFSLVGDEGKDALSATPLVVVSERIGDLAKKFGCRKVILAEEASDQGLVSAICQWSTLTSR